MNWKIFIVFIFSLVGKHATESLNASENIENCDSFIKDLNIEKEILKYGKHNILTEEYTSRNINNYNCLQYLIKILEDEQEENMEDSAESSLLKTGVTDRLKRKHKARFSPRSKPKKLRSLKPF